MNRTAAEPDAPVPSDRDDVAAALAVARELAARLRDGTGVHAATARDVAALFGLEVLDDAALARVTAILLAADVEAQPPLDARAPDAPVVLISAAGPPAPLGPAPRGTTGVGVREAAARSPLRTAGAVAGGIAVLSLVIGFASVLAPSSPAPRGGPPATTAAIDRAALTRLTGDRAVAERDWPAVGRALAALDGDDDRRLRAAARRTIADDARGLLAQERWRGARRELLAGDAAFGLGGRSARLLAEARTGLKAQRTAIAGRERAERDAAAAAAAVPDEPAAPAGTEQAPPTTTPDPEPGTADDGTAGSAEAPGATDGTAGTTP